MLSNTKLLLDAVNVFLSLLTPLCCRIAGDTALDKNIHESVSAQIKKNFAKSKWKVSQISSLSWMHFDVRTSTIYAMWFISSLQIKGI